MRVKMKLPFSERVLHFFLLFLTLSLVLAALDSKKYSILFAQQEPLSKQYLIFTAGGLVHAQQISGDESLVFSNISEQQALNAIGVLPYDVYDISSSPLEAQSFNEDYGFFHGVWSADRLSFAYLELQNGTPNYRLRLYTQGNTSDLLSSKMDESRGYLDPVGWSSPNSLWLTERYIIDRVDSFRLWQLDTLTGELSLLKDYEFPSLQGRSFVLPSASSAFVGIDVENREGYLLDLSTAAADSFYVKLFTEPVASSSTSSGSTNNELSIDDDLPWVSVRTVPLGFANALQIDKLKNVKEAPPHTDTVRPSSSRPNAFLYWPLPNDVRTIVAYPDSKWTEANNKHTYSNHQGTDIVSRPVEALTPIYASAPGTVVEVYNDCPDHTQDYGPGEAPKNCPAPMPLGPYNWGNMVLISHVVTVNGNAEVWYSGYGHLKKDSIPANITKYAEVCRGATIGLMGHTGRSQGQHLHFEPRNGTGYNAWDDPWGASNKPHGATLWVGGTANPLAAIDHSTCGGCCGCTLELAASGGNDLLDVFLNPRPPAPADTSIALAAEPRFDLVMEPSSGLIAGDDYGFYAPEEKIAAALQDTFAPAASTPESAVAAGDNSPKTIDVPAERPASANYKLGSSVLAMGGGSLKSGNYSMISTVGQLFAPSRRSSSNYQVHSGFLPASALTTPGGPTYTPTPTRPSQPKPNYNNSAYLPLVLQR